ncbi:uncharacterized protein N7459_007187 [Penicillium hispanicum]|uniref:uncharacterized protein n=1 Tax=Penicillium hispanicum TaxID=1080232 RepID=UPI00253F9807|nr:uncharacterized protein N7459_007187 [Penicillium hispanicum]KAJ5578223.1 hypothetical protein N7459_007187 [Penicillium hispanicum]
MTEPIVKNLAVPKASWILVTGVNGYIASHIASQLLRLGYNVRGTVRDPFKSKWIEELYKVKYEDCKFELVQVEDATRPGAFHDAIQGISGVAHVATVFGGTPNIIDSVIDMNRNLLITAAQEPTVKRFVYTSSSEAAVYSSFLEHDEMNSTLITANTWNEKAVERVRGGMLPPTPKGGFDVYAASKTLGEQATWQWVRECQPGFVVNTVLPSLCFGPSVDPKNQGHASSSGWPVAIFGNEFHKIWPFLKYIIPTGAYFVDAEDVALLHVAGLINQDVRDERLFAFGKPFTWKEITQIFQRDFPDREFDREPLMHPDRTGTLEIEAADRAEQLLRSMGKPGWSTLEATLKANVADLI